MICVCITGGYDRKTFRVGTHSVTLMKTSLWLFHDRLVNVSHWYLNSVLVCGLPTVNIKLTQSGLPFTL